MTTSLSGAVDLDVADILTKTISATRTKGVTGDVCPALAKAIISGLGRRGLVIVSADDVPDPPDEALRVLKRTRKVILESLEEGVPPRDLASLSRRLHEVIKDITVIEERHRGERRMKGDTTHGADSGTAGTSESGAIDF